MPRPKSLVPQMRRDRHCGQACIYLNRRRIYLGRYGSAEAQRKYHEVVQHLTADALDAESLTAVDDPAADSPVSINELCWEFMQQKLPTYKPAESGESGEVACFRLVIRILRESFGETTARQFGPRKLRLVRETMIEKGWSRPFINKQVMRLRAIFRFGVSWEMVPQTVADAMKSVPGLRAGETAAAETKRREPVTDERINAAKSRMRQRNCDIVDLLVLTGARPKELLSLRPCDIDDAGDVWKAELQHHKNAHRGHTRTLWFGPQAQLILKRCLFEVGPQDRLLPMKVSTLSYSIKQACKRAKVEHFTAYHLRHTAATKIRDELGIEHAQASLGHRTVNMTAHYSEKAERKAQEAARRLG